MLLLLSWSAGALVVELPVLHLHSWRPRRSQPSLLLRRQSFREKCIKASLKSPPLKACPEPERDRLCAGRRAWLTSGEETLERWIVGGILGDG